MYGTKKISAVRGLTNEQRSIEKNMRDVEALTRCARFVITVTDDEIKLINNDQKQRKGRKIVPLIVVIANVNCRGKVVPASVLEIGYKRTRPYQRVHVGKNKVYLQSRKVDHVLSRDKFEKVYPSLLHCLEEVLAETRANWKSDEPWSTGKKLYERGVRLTVHTHDKMLSQALLREGVRYLDIATLPDYSYWINKRLQHSQFTSYSHYGSSVRRAAESVFGSMYAESAYGFEALMQRIGKRTLLENALRDLFDFQHEPDAMTRLTFGDDLASVPKAKGLFFWLTPNQPDDTSGTHATSCLRFEVLFDRQNPRSRFTQDKSDQCAITDTEEHVYDRTDLDDIPF